MATTIINAAEISAGSSTSSEITNVGDLVLMVKVSDSTDNPEVTYTVKVNESSLGYVDLTDEDSNTISFKTTGNQSKRVTIKGIESESVKLYYTIGKGATGTITAVANKTDITVA